MSPRLPVTAGSHRPSAPSLQPKRMCPLEVVATERAGLSGIISMYPLAGRRRSQRRTLPSSPAVTTYRSDSRARLRTDPWRPSWRFQRSGQRRFQSRTDPSMLPVMRVPSVVTATPRTWSSWCPTTRPGLPGCAGSQSRTSPSWLPETIMRSGVTARTRMLSLQRPSWVSVWRGFEGSQRRMVPSMPPEATRPSWVTATARTTPSWRPISRPSSPSVSGFHCKRAPSILPPDTSIPRVVTAKARTAPRGLRR